MQALEQPGCSKVGGGTVCIFNFNKQNNTVCDGAQLDGTVPTINCSPLEDRQAELPEPETSLAYRP